MTGFTGIRWDARPAEKLSRDLSHGAGAKPLFEAGMSWASIGAALRELDTEFTHVRKLLGEGWRGRGDADMVKAVDRLSHWVSETADMALRNAEAAERQAVAHTVAVAAMPDAEVISALGQLEDAMKAVAAPPNSLIAGGLAKLDEQAHGMKAQAARVMDSYELATTPVSKPLPPASAPVHLVKRAPIADEKAKAAAKLALQQEFAGQGAMLAQLAAMAASAPLGAYRSDEYVSQTRRAETRTELVAQSESSTVVRAVNATGPAPVADAQNVTQSQFVPATPMAAAASASGPNHQAALPVATNYASVQDVAPTGSQVAAPSVIGVPDREGT